jgi:hypothetical protein
MSKLSSVERYKQIANFESVRRTLLEPRFADRLEKPLAFWALPADRRLPLAFLGRKLSDLLNTSFDDLAAAPGIGRKKMAALVKLLQRATKDDGREQTIDAATAESTSAQSGTTDFDPAVVSEAIWEQWRHTVRRHGVGPETLGRLAPSLQALPTVIWEAPLSSYLDYSVIEIQQLKTHGEKRVRVILQVFHAVHEILGHSRVASHLTVRLAPKFVLPVESWIAACLEQTGSYDDQGLKYAVAKPLVQQIQIDCGAPIAKLAEGRLGLSGSPQTVRAQSRKMNVTRARIYQLLEQCEQAMQVRWPEGKLLLRSLQTKLSAGGVPAADTQLLSSLIGLFFPNEAEKSHRKKSDAGDTD